MIVAKLTISYDRGVVHNQPKDLSEQAPVLGRGDKTADGKIVRGLGTSYRSEEDAKVVAERDKAAKLIYNEVRERFLCTPIDGLYIVPKRGALKAFINDMETRVDITVRVSEFELTTADTNSLDGAELGEWATRIKRQLGSVQLGRSREADADGLRALETLASCPVLTPDTQGAIKSMIRLVRENKLDRVELKRKIETLDVQISAEPLLSPRRAPLIREEVA